MREQLQTKLEAEGISLCASFYEKVEIYATELLKWNKVHNLTGATSLHELEYHIIDCVYPIKFIQQPQSLLDIGSGAGFPGIILALAFPQTKTILTEPLKKRASFLHYIKTLLDLQHVNILSKRVEEVQEEPVDLVVSRAVTQTSLLLELSAHLSHDKSAYLLYKGERVYSEIEAQEFKDFEIIEHDKRKYLYIKES